MPEKKVHFSVRVKPELYEYVKLAKERKGTLTEGTEFLIEEGAKSLGVEMPISKEEAHSQQLTTHDAHTKQGLQNIEARLQRIEIAIADDTKLNHLKTAILNMLNHVAKQEAAQKSIHQPQAAVQQQIAPQQTAPEPAAVPEPPQTPAIEPEPVQDPVQESPPEQVQVTPPAAQQPQAEKKIHPKQSLLKINLGNWEEILKKQRLNK